MDGMEYTLRGLFIRLGVLGDLGGSIPRAIWIRGL